MSKQLIDIKVIIKIRTAKAVMVSETEGDEKGIWLPLSQIEIEMDGPTSPYATITMPEWLALEKDLI
jgi:hypothetical protein